eukprot:scaffold40430_cov65-Phaeocystis_antarctica.AAC.9
MPLFAAPGCMSAEMCGGSCPAQSRRGVSLRVGGRGELGPGVALGRSHAWLSDYPRRTTSLVGDSSWLSPRCLARRSSLKGGGHLGNYRRSAR